MGIFNARGGGAREPHEPVEPLGVPSAEGPPAPLLDSESHGPAEGPDAALAECPSTPPAESEPHVPGEAMGAPCAEGPPAPLLNRESQRSVEGLDASVAEPPSTPPVESEPHVSVEAVGDPPVEGPPAPLLDNESHGPVEGLDVPSDGAAATSPSKKPSRRFLKAGSASVDKCRARAPRPVYQPRREDGGQGWDDVEVADVPPAMVGPGGGVSLSSSSSSSGAVKRGNCVSSVEAAKAPAEEPAPGAGEGKKRRLATAAYRKELEAAAAVKPSKPIQWKFGMFRDVQAKSKRNAAEAVSDVSVIPLGADDDASPAKPASPKAGAAAKSKGRSTARQRKPKAAGAGDGERDGLDVFIEMASDGESESGDDGADASGPGGRHGGSQWRRTQKHRRLKVGDEGEEPDKEEEEHEDAKISKEVLACLDMNYDDVPEALREEVARVRAAIHSRRLVRPYHGLITYGREVDDGVPLAARDGQRVRHVSVGRQGLGSRAFCVGMLSSMVWSSVVFALEGYGILPPRPLCPACGQKFSREDLRVRVSKGSTTYALPGDVEVQQVREQAHWRHRKCNRECTAGADAEIWQEGYTLRQNASLLLHWARQEEPGSDSLAQDAFVDHNRLVSGWLSKARRVVATVQKHENETIQIGGPGVEVEIDEVCFRARYINDGVVGHCREWQRYVCATERHGGKVILQKLPTKRVKGAGQGGGGSISREELHAFIFRAGGVPLLRAGTIVHTDGAKAYCDLDWRDAPEVAEPPSPEMVAAATGPLPRCWRYETCREVLQREAAERREQRGRNPEWAAKYRSLRLVHTSVCHSKKLGGVAGREFVAVRRVVVHPDDADAHGGHDSWAQGNVTWRKAGTQSVDGYWKDLRRKGAHRGVNTSLEEAVENAVLVHQWAQWATPSKDMMAHLGETLCQYRALRAADMEAASMAQNDGRAGSSSAAAVRGKVHWQAHKAKEAARSKRVARAKAAGAAHAEKAAVRAKAKVAPARRERQPAAAVQRGGGAPPAAVAPAKAAAAAGPAVPGGAASSGAAAPVPAATPGMWSLLRHQGIFRGELRFAIVWWGVARPHQYWCCAWWCSPGRCVLSCSGGLRAWLHRWQSMSTSPFGHSDGFCWRVDGSWPMDSSASATLYSIAASSKLLMSMWRRPLPNGVGQLP